MKSSGLEFEIECHERQAQANHSQKFAFGLLGGRNTRLEDPLSFRSQRRRPQLDSYSKRVLDALEFTSGTGSVPCTTANLSDNAGAHYCLLEEARSWTTQVCI